MQILINCFYKLGKKSVAVCTALLLIFLKSVAQTFPFPCDGKLYFFQADTINGLGTLSYIDNYTSVSPTVVQLCTMPNTSSTPAHNSMGANPIDHYLYYCQGQDIYKIDAACNFTLQCSNLPVTISGCFDDVGRYWFTENTASISQLYAYDLNTCTIKKGPFTLPVGGPDIVYNKANGMLYLSRSGQILIIDTLGIVQDSINTGSYNGSPTGWGGIAFGTDGRLYGIGYSSITYDTYIGAIPVTSYSATVSNIINLNPGGYVTGGMDMASFLCSYAVEISSTDISCFGDNNGIATANPVAGIPGYSYLWQPGGQTTQTITGLSPGTYKVTIKDAVDSVTTDSVVIINPAPVVMNASNSLTICTGQNTILSVVVSGGTPSYSYLWNNLSSGTVNKIIIAPTVNGTYIIIATDANGCDDTTIVTINVNPSPTITVNDICLGENVIVSSIGANTYLWSNGATTQIISISVPGSYTITATDAKGCTGYDGISVTEYCENSFLYIPNAFTPDADGKNELFLAMGVGVTSFQMKIFNRWGQLLFTSNDINKGWDGTFKGIKAEEGIYVWELSYQNTFNENKKMTGKVALIK